MRAEKECRDPLNIHPLGASQSQKGLLTPFSFLSEPGEGMLVTFRLRRCSRLNNADKTKVLPGLAIIPTIFLRSDGN